MDPDHKSGETVPEASLYAPRGMKTIYCCTITTLALRLLRRFDGDVIGHEAIICNFSYEEPARDHKGYCVEGAFRMYFPNQQALCYTLSGEIAVVL